MAETILPEWPSSVNLELWQGFYVSPDNHPLHRPGMYAIIHIATGRAYIGISRNVYIRLRDHANNAKKSKNNQKLIRSLQKYGLNAFLAAPLAYSVDDTTDWLPSTEAIMIESCNAVDHGFNIMRASKGVGPYGEEFNEIQRRQWDDPDKRKRQGIRFSNTMSVRWADPEIASEYVAGQRASWARDYEYRANATRTALTDLWSDPDRRAEMTETQRRLTTERFKDPAVRKHQSEVITQAWKDKPYTWITNDVETLKVPAADPLPPGWRVGRAFRPRPASQQSFWITDGTESTRIQSGQPIPEGWRVGRVMRDYYTEEMRLVQADPELVARRAAKRAATLAANPDLVARMRANHEAAMPEQMRKQQEYFADPANRAKQSERAKASWARRKAAAAD